MMADETLAGRQWEDWTVAWRSGQGADPSTPVLDQPMLSQLLMRQRRHQIFVAIGELTLLAALLVGTACGLLHGLEPWHVVWLASLWGFAAIAIAFAWWNRRHTWRAVGEGVEQHVELARLRCHRELRTIPFVIGLFVAEALVAAGQLRWFGRLGPVALVLLAAAGGMVAGWSVWQRRRVRAELARVEAFAAELDGA